MPRPLVPLERRRAYSKTGHLYAISTYMTREHMVKLEAFEEELRRHTGRTIPRATILRVALDRLIEQHRRAWEKDDAGK